jgi:hypothetical protein
LKFNIEPMMPRPRERVCLQEGLKLDLYRLGPDINQSGGHTGSTGTPLVSVTLTLCRPLTACHGQERSAGAVGLHLDLAGGPTIPPRSSSRG